MGNYSRVQLRRILFEMNTLSEIPIGFKKGLLTILKEAPSKNKYERNILCICDCGNNKVIGFKWFKKSKGILNCGCIPVRIPSRKNENSQFLKHRLYTIWIGIKKRCFNKKSRAYKWYGAKGVSMCESWESRFLNFYNWANENGYKDHLTIERLDTTKDYSPPNCTWIEWSKQNDNKSNSRIITVDGQTMNTAQASRKFGVRYTTLISRLNKGWDIKDALK